MAEMEGSEAVKRVSGRRRLSFGLGAAGVSVLALAGCGSSQHFANIPRPPTPIDLSVYINQGQHVSVSPDRIGGGPVIMYVTNEANATETLSVNADGDAIASSGPIVSGQTARVTANLSTGPYTISVNSHIKPATLHVGKPRPNADNVLLQP
jgi:hypothetical protein